MGYFYFDDSVHQRGGFVIGAFVYSVDDLQAPLETILGRHGLEPGVSEFKSGIHVGRNPIMAKVREDIFSEVLGRGNSGVGIVVVPLERRESLADEGLRCLEQILERCFVNPDRKRVHSAFFDEGIIPTRAAPPHPSECTIHLKQDSKKVLGIQVADLAAHSCSTVLLEKQGLITKSIRLEEPSGYENEEVALGFSLWAQLRYSFMIGPATGEEKEEHSFPMLGFGLYLSDHCQSALREAAKECFGEVYLGCIH